MMKPVTSFVRFPKECGYPPHIGARMKKSAYGLNDAPRRWWQVVDKALLSYGLVPTRADRCTYILYGERKFSTSVTKKEPQKELVLEDALELLMNASVRNNSQGRKPEVHLSSCRRSLHGRKS